MKHHNAPARITMMLCLFSLVWLGVAEPPQHLPEPDRSGPPQLGLPPKLNLAPVQRLELPGGLPVFLMEKHNLPLLQINLLIRAGSAMDPLGKKGLASLTLDMLDEGAGSHDALALADEIDYLGASIQTGADLHTATIALHTPVSKLAAALPLMADIVLRPRFEEKEFLRLRQDRATTLLQWQDEPRIIGQLLFHKLLYGPEHPYGQPRIGTQTSLSAITTADLKTFHQTYFHPGNAAFIVVGDIDGATLLPKLQAQFGSWPDQPIPAPHWPAASSLTSRTVYLVDKPKAPQSEIFIGALGAPRQTADYFPLVLMNTILGGSFTSRLNQNLRETHGYTYHASSHFDFRPLPGPFFMYSAVQSEVTAKAISEMLAELQSISEPIPAPELERTKQYLAFSYPKNFEEVATIAGEIEEIVSYNLPLNFCNDYIDQILQVSGPDVKRVSQHYLNPAGLLVVVVGDIASIGNQVRDIKLGEVKLVSVESVFKP